MTERPRELERLSSIITDRTGLVFPPSRRHDMEGALAQALKASGASPEHLRGLLEGDSAARDELIASLTVGESYFFRDPGQFALLREEMLPGLMAARGGAPLRLWSAGCAAGEEPYSLAILCCELGIGDRATVVGTDISRTRLAAAKRGVYTRWALRGLEPEAIERYFEHKNNRYALRPKYRGLVDFRYLNLAEDRYPSLATGIWGFDLILCRNVLIYFDRPTVAHVAQRLLDSLSEDGWLILGAADPAISELADCDIELTGAGLAYRRPGRGGGVGPRGMSGGAGWIDGGRELEATLQPPPTAPWDDGLAGRAENEAPTDRSEADGPADPRESDERAGFTASAGPTGGGSVQPPPSAGPPTAAESEPDVLADARLAYAARDYDRAARLAEMLLPSRESADVHALRVRSLANLGEMKLARRAIDIALGRFHDSAELMYLHAVLLAEAGRSRDSAAAARRALYLNRSMIVAHMALGQALRQTGDRAGARRALRNASALLNGLPPESTVPSSDGETVARLRTNVQVQLRLLEEVA